MPVGRYKIYDDAYQNNISYILLETIRSELESLFNSRITDRMLSNFLGMDEKYITKKYNEIRNGKLGYITEDVFYKIKNLVIDCFCKKCKMISFDLKKKFDDYEDFLLSHKFLRSEERSKLFHPNLKADYFKVINTREKAYWLGFLFADGFITNEQDKYREYYRIAIKVGIEDENQLDRFIFNLGLNIEHKHYYEEEQEFEGKIVIVKYYRIMFAHQKMADDLIKLGMVPQKSKIIRLPMLTTYDLYLSFLLGYFDGDGEMGSSRVWSGSREFLEDIKSFYNVKNEIKYKKSNLGSAWGLSLGPELFNAMLDNYENSMERKRIRLTIR